MKHRNDDGFTTVEILVSIVLFAVAMAGLSSVLHSTMRTNVLAARLTMATTLAQEQLEELQAMAFDDVSAGSTDIVSSVSEASTYDDNTTSSRSGGTTYHVDWAVESGPSGTGTKEVAVTVTWGGEGHHVQLKTLIF